MSIHAVSPCRSLSLASPHHTKAVSSPRLRRTFAASIAYYSLLSLFPFFLLAFSILASVTTSDTDRAEILGFVLRYFPKKFDFVTTQFDALQQARVRLGVAGSILMIWAAMGVFGAPAKIVDHTDLRVQSSNCIAPLLDERLEPLLLELEQPAHAIFDELARKGITVNAVAPGFIETDMVGSMPETALSQVKAMTPVGRLGKPEEIADAVVFLASPRSGFVTGQVLGVNGGMYM